jgi:hypothetical protein
LNRGPASPGRSRRPAAFELPVLVRIREGDHRAELRYDGVEPLTIGRSDDCTIPLATGRASRLHAQILGESGRFTLIDCDSSNGTRVAGESITRHSLQAGDVIEIGEARITFGEKPRVEPAPAPVRAGGARRPVAEREPAPERAPLVRQRSSFGMIELLLAVLLFLLLALVAQEYRRAPATSTPSTTTAATPEVPTPGTTGFDFGGRSFLDREASESLDRVEDLVVGGAARYDIIPDLRALEGEYSDTETGRRSGRLARLLESLRDSERSSRNTIAEGALAKWLAEERYGEALVATRFLEALELDVLERAGWRERGEEIRAVADLRLRAFEDTLGSLLEAGLGGEALRTLVGARDRFSGLPAYEEALTRYVELGLGEVPQVARGRAIPPEFIELDGRALRAFEECRFRDLPPILHRALGLDLPSDVRVRVLEELVEASYLQVLWRELVEGVAGASVEVALPGGARGKLLRVTEEGVEIERSIEGGSARAVETWRDLAPATRTAIFRAAPLGRDGLLGLAFLARRAGDPGTFEETIFRLHRRGSEGAELAAAVYARHRGEALPEEGYVEHRGRLMTGPERTAEIAREKELKEQEREAIARMRRMEKAEKVEEVIEWVHLLREQGEFSLATRVLRELVAKTDEAMGAEARRLLLEPLLASVPLRESGDPERRIDFFILGDGYLGEDDHQEAFLAAARSCESILFKRDPYREYASYFNVTAVHLQSQDEGVDREPGGVEKDTACDAQVRWDVITCNPEKVFSHLRKFPEAMARDHQGIVIANDFAGVMTGGGGVVSLSKAGLGVVHHEVGHSFGGLRDEYDSEPGNDPEKAPPPGRQGNLPVRELRPNLMEGSDREAVLRDAYWKYWIDAGESAWWNKSKVSVFEGGDRRPFEVWRPQAGCMMRDNTAFCVVCMEVMVKQIYRRVRPIDVLEPAAGDVVIGAKEETVFQVTPMQPFSHDLEVEWRLVPLGRTDPRRPEATGLTGVSEGQGDVYTRIAQRIDLDGRKIHGAQLRAKDMEPGFYRLKVEVRDPTPWVIDDPDELLVDRADWLIEVKGE